MTFGDDSRRLEVFHLIGVGNVAGAKIGHHLWPFFSWNKFF